MKQIDYIKIVPFVRKGDSYNFSDTYLKQVFRTTVMERTSHKTFYDGSVKNPEEFLIFIKNKNILVFFVILEKKEDVGFFWITPFINKSAFINYCFYKSFIGKGTLKISRSCIDYIFNIKDDYGNYAFDTLLGITPYNNKLAVKFLQKSGMQILCNIPDIITDYQYNKNIDGVLSYINRDKYIKLNFFKANLFSSFFK